MTRALVLAFVVACGGGGKKSDTANTGDTATAGDTAAGTTTDDIYGGAAYGGYHRTPELTAFHDAIATRTTATTACPAAATLHDTAAAIGKAGTPPGASADMWSGEANELLGLTEDLVAACGGSDAAATQADVDATHRSFQRLLRLLSAAP